MEARVGMLHERTLNLETKQEKHAVENRVAEGKMHERVNALESEIAKALREIRTDIEASVKSSNTAIHERINQLLWRVALLWGAAIILNVFLSALAAVIVARAFGA